MPRRYVIKSKEIQRRRGVYWERYYRFRNFAKVCGLDPIRVLNALVAAKLPEPEIQVDGSIYEPHDVICAKHEALNVLELRNNFANGASQTFITWFDLMCAYFWTENGWIGYVRLFEALPDPVEDHYLVYDHERDGGLLVPMSSKPKRGDVRIPVDKSVGNLGTSKVQVPRNKYKSAFVLPASSD